MLFTDSIFRPTAFDVAPPAHISLKVCWVGAEMKITIEGTDGIYCLPNVRSFHAPK
jgi:hypothetical protein